ncbi:MAG: InlB B-repeat-containing protein [Bacilli bacterium]|jgi:uncharacterized repeat protein (TIGR02543 family)
MKKILKGLFALGLVASLGACKPKPSVSEVEKVTVTFFVNDVGGVFQEVEVEVGSKVARPATDPTRSGYDFVNWFVSYDADAALFDFEQAITEDTDVFAHWSLQYVPDTRNWQLVGSFQNTEWPNVWKENDPTMQMLDVDPNDNRNLFKFTLEMGQWAEFKVKTMEDGWEPGTDFGFANYDPEQYNTAAIISEVGLGNLTVNTAGKYEVYWDSDYEVIAVNRLGDAVGEGVTQDSDPDSIKQWVLIGQPNGWDDSKEGWTFTHNQAGTEYWLRNVVLLEGEEFKFRANGSWNEGDAGFGSLVFAEGDTVSAAGFTAKEEGNADSNIVVAGAQGMYSFKLIPGEGKSATVTAFKFSLSETNLGIAGSFNGWSAEGYEMTKEVDSTDPTKLKFTYTYEGLEVEAGAQFKLKPMNTWEISFGNLDGSNVEIEAGGTYKVNVEITLGTTVATRGYEYTMWLT